MNSIQSEDGSDSQQDQGKGGLKLAQAVAGVLATCLGLIAFSSVAANPRFQAYHTQDVTWLIIAGVNFGLALGLLINFIKWPAPRPAAKKET